MRVTERQNSLKLPLLQLCFISITLSACGAPNPDDDNDSGFQDRQIVADRFPPAAYTLTETETCQTDRSPVTVTGATIHEWTGLSTAPTTVALTGVVSKNSLTSPAIRSMTYGDHYARTCDFRRGRGEVCTDSKGNDVPWTFQESSGPLQICDPDGRYPRQSYEAVGLAAAHYISQAHAAIRLAWPSLDVDQIGVSVLPNFIEYHDYYPSKGEFKQLEKYVTNNMLYFPRSEMIAVFPERVDRVADAAGYLWDSQFVFAHEYGHHIETMISQDVWGDMGLSWDPLSHSYQWPEGMALQDQQDRRAAKRILGAVSEAVADLFSYYASHGDNRSVIGLPGIGEDRDVGSSEYRDGVRKVLTANRLQILAGEDTSRPITAEDARFARIHQAGATLAYGLNRAFGEMSRGRLVNSDDIGEPIDYQQRLTVLLQWVERWHTQLRRQSTTGKFDYEVMVEILRTSNRAALTDWLIDNPVQGPNLTRGDVESAVCDVFATTLPGLGPAPFRQTDGC